MAKKVSGYIKLQIPAGKATPAPPVGPALGQHGVNIVEFTKQFKKACNLKSGSGVPNKTKVAKITKAQVKEIAELKMPDLNAASVETAMSMIEGTCRSMGVTVVED